MTGLAARPYSRIVRRLLPALVFAITFVVFRPALDSEFLNWDDRVALLKNGSFRGLGASQITWLRAAATTEVHLFKGR